MAKERSFWGFFFPRRGAGGGESPAVDKAVQEETPVMGSGATLRQRLDQEGLEQGAWSKQREVSTVLTDEAGASVSDHVEQARASAPQPFTSGQRVFSNRGMIALGSPGREDGCVSALQVETLIVSGLSRSGTSMIALALRLAGVHMGSLIDDVVYEDNEIAGALKDPSRAALRGIIAERNASHEIWGFKRPNIHEWLEPEQITMFREPKLIIAFRDPVAIAERNILAEYIPERIAVRQAIAAAGVLGTFIEQIPCPVLLVSYEKALSGPETFVDGLLRFCDLSPEPEKREKMIAAIQASPERYVRTAALHFRGVIDGVNRSGRLFGWCRREHSTDPVELTLFVDDNPVRNFVAGLLREDLRSAKIGEGRHGFLVDLNKFDLPESAVIRVTVRGRSFELRNSGRTVGELTMPERVGRQ